VGNRNVAASEVISLKMASRSVLKPGRRDRRRNATAESSWMRLYEQRVAPAKGEKAKTTSAEAPAKAPPAAAPSGTHLPKSDPHIRRDL